MDENAKFVDFFPDDDFFYAYILFDDFTYIRISFDAPLPLRFELESMTKNDFKQKYKTF